MSRKKYEAVIGLEVHAQMLTGSKIFCGCPTKFGAPPNSQTCPVCTGMPGSLPVLNRKALELVIKTGLVMNCRIAPVSRFARKNYFYPDLPKGYQISQYELPVCEDGFLEISVEGGRKKIGITRIHMEEDAGKNIHEGAGPYSLVDLNRAGVPLMEIVSEPDLRTPSEAGQYMRMLRSIVRYLEVCDGNMEQGSLRCDANVSVREEGQKELGVKVELKNMNSFRYVEKALEYEIKRQTQALESGEKIIQETRLFDPATGATQSMRTKEEAHDYRYFPEPDLVPFVAGKEWIEEIRASIPELPAAKVQRYIAEFGLPEYNAAFLSEERKTAEWFEEAVRSGSDPKVAANWIMGELTRLLNELKIPLDEIKITQTDFVRLLKLIDNGTISGKIAKAVIEEMAHTGKSPDEIVREQGLLQISDEASLTAAVEEAIAKNPKEAERFRAGEEKLLGFFAGQVMRSTKGKANPKLLNEILKKKLS